MKVVEKICRLLLGVVFVFSGLVKLNDPHGTQYKIEDYFAACSLRIDENLALILAVALALLELGIGIAALYGSCKKLNGWLAFIFMLIMTPITLWLALKNPISDCGCFGDAIVLTNWQTFFKNVILLFAATICFIAYFKEKNKRLWVPVVTVVAGLVMAIYSLQNLPFVDFRPYKVGADIHNVDNFFVEQDGDDITADLLDNDSVTYLLVAPYLHSCDKEKKAECNKLYEYCQKSGYRFLCLTASGEEEIEQWKKDTSASYPFCFADDIELKTMVRANPGIVVLKRGVVIEKRNVRN